MQEQNLITENLECTPQVYSFLKETAKWGRFLGIMGFIIVGLTIIMAFMLPSVISHFNPDEATVAASKTGITANFLIIAILTFIPSLFILRFSNRMKTALEQNSQPYFESSFENLKSVFKYYGILTIIILAIYLLGVIGFFLSLQLETT